MFRQPGFHARLLRFVQPHAQLGAAPDSVVQLHDPLFLGQVAQFGFIQTVAEIFAQIGEAVGAGQDQLALAAVGAGIAARQGFRQPAVRTAQFGRVTVAVAVDVTARQRGVFIHAGPQPG